MSTSAAPMTKLPLLLAIALAVLLLANGTFMLVNSEAWYFAVPGVPDTGAFNPHFIRDIGFIYVLSGLGMAGGLIWPSQRPGLWGAVAAWQICHALFHVWEVAVGICSPDALLRDFGGVTLPALITLGLTIWALKRQSVSTG